MEHKLGTELKLYCDPSDTKRIAELTSGIKCVVPVGENTQTIDGIVRKYLRALIDDTYYAGDAYKVWFNTELIEQPFSPPKNNYQLRTTVTVPKRISAEPLTAVITNLIPVGRNKEHLNLDLYVLFREIVFTLSQAKGSPFDGFEVIEREPEVNAQVGIVELSFEESAALLF